MTTLLITGGTGSLGQKIVERLLKGHGPYYNRIIVYSRDERKQEDMARRFKPIDSKNRLRFFIGDVRDKSRLALAVREADHIIHAAALKIVPAMEYNPSEAIKTNIGGTQNIIECVVESGWYNRKFILVSTDKAVAPRNLYGATKMTAEKLTLAANNIMGQDGPVFGVVRYGNVTGSRGSVVPLFQEVLADKANRKKEVPITHVEMTRFWITLDEASQFVLSSLYTIKQQSNKIFIPNMPAYKITDLAKAMGAKSINVIGIRDGEKLHEQITDEADYRYMYNTLRKGYSISSDVAPRITVRKLRSLLKKEGFIS